ncbi:hypothetical protein P4O66_019696 [Electrophorus voltai]|uniref:Ephrin RBD domain-containing protein n=1 Tax=Electrophorus voltai TaxID=2609070 RepID=A0AAD9E346_9TELE|nr:hypothetical protein P4O66_019696 [Electrophorus voltai]
MTRCKISDRGVKRIIRKVVQEPRTTYGELQKTWNQQKAICLNLCTVGSDVWSPGISSKQVNLRREGYTVQVNVNDYLDIYCPHYNLSQRGALERGVAEQYVLYMVSYRGYRTCDPQMGFKRWECNRPHAPHAPIKFSEKFQRYSAFSLGYEFSVGHEYYYIFVLLQTVAHQPPSAFSIGGQFLNADGPSQQWSSESLVPTSHFSIPASLQRSLFLFPYAVLQFLECPQGYVPVEECFFWCQAHKGALENHLDIATPTHHHGHSCLRLRVFVCCSTVSHADDDSDQSPPDYTVRPKIHDIDEFNPKIPKLEKSVSGSSPSRDRLLITVAMLLLAALLIS